jgi:hypothetical protein
MTRSLHLRRVVLAAVALSATVAFTASSQAAQPLVQIGIGMPAVQPPSQVFLPKFGFQSYNLSGIGDRITFVDCHGLAAEMGLEPGDIVLRLNGMPLNYHGAWNDALTHAIYDGGVVTLAIRDVNTGAVVHRTTYLNGGAPVYGPVTPKSGPVVQHYKTQKFVHPAAPKFVQPMPIGVPGPMTQKSMNGNHNNNLSGPKGLKANPQSFQKFGKLVQKIGE